MTSDRPRGIAWFRGIPWYGKLAIIGLCLMLVGPSAMLALLLTHVAVEVDPNLVAASASRAAALLREERGRSGMGVACVAVSATG